MLLDINTRVEVRSECGQVYSSCNFPLQGETEIYQGLWFILPTFVLSIQNRQPPKSYLGSLLVQVWFSISTRCTKVYRIKSVNRGRGGGGSLMLHTNLFVGVNKKMRHSKQNNSSTTAAWRGNKKGKDCMLQVPAFKPRLANGIFRRGLLLTPINRERNAPKSQILISGLSW